jgi:tetrahydromethanopterin S-methyltransferase subunit C
VTRAAALAALLVLVWGADAIARAGYPWLVGIPLAAVTAAAIREERRHR